MKRLLIFLALVLALAGVSNAQSALQERIVPDCTLQFKYTVVSNTVTAVGVTAGGSRTPLTQDASTLLPLNPQKIGFDNRSAACTTWNVTYTTEGISVVSLEIDSAPSVAAAGAGAPGDGSIAGSWSVWPAAQVAAGQSLPLTTLSQGQVTVSAFFPWVSINVNSATGTGAIYGYAYGWRTQGSQESSSGASPVILTYNRTAITTSANTQVKATSGIVHTITITQPGATSNSIVVVDTAVAACTGGTTIMTIPSAQLVAALTPLTLTLDANFNSGICVTTAGTTAPQLVVTWR